MTAGKTVGNYIKVRLPRQSSWHPKRSIYRSRWQMGGASRQSPLRQSGLPPRVEARPRRRRGNSGPQSDIRAGHFDIGARRLRGSRSLEATRLRGYSCFTIVRLITLSYNRRMMVGLKSMVQGIPLNKPRLTARTQIPTHAHYIHTCHAVCQCMYELPLSHRHRFTADRTSGIIHSGPF